MFFVPLIGLCLPIFLCALLFYVVNLAFENTATCYQLALYRGRPSPSSLGSLKTSVGMHLLWDCVYNFQTIEVCWFLFQELALSCSIYYVCSTASFLAFQQATELSLVFSTILLQVEIIL